MKHVFIFTLLLASTCMGMCEEAVSLAGEWRFMLDGEDAGLDENWYSQELRDKIQLPGILQAQSYGDEITTNTPWVMSLCDKNWFLRADYTNGVHAGAVKVPFLCQPPRHYLGAAWYQRDVDIPTNWSGKRVVLFLERPHWESRVWLDDTLVGTNNSLCTPHEFELGIHLAPGRHRLTVRVDNRMILPYRPDAHSVSDSLAQSWNGIVGKMELRSTELVWLENVQVFPATNGDVRLKVEVGNLTGQPWKGMVHFGGQSVMEQWGAGGGTREVSFICGKSAKFWDEFTPNLQRVTFRLEGAEVDERQELVFGLREFEATPQGFTINGRLTYLRGTHNGGDFPLTGCPPTDVAYWRKLFVTCKEWGLNHMRFHSFCPPEAAFSAADEAGFYLQIEPGMWNTFIPDSAMAAILDAETARILKTYGNHPSFVLFSPSNEPKGRWREVLPQWAERWREVDPRRLYTSGTGFTDTDAPGPLDKVDYTVTQRFGRQQIRGTTGWFGRDYPRALTNVQVPVVAHELGQWCAYPDYDVMKKFTGYMQPGNFEIFRDSAAVHGVLERDKDFANASGRFQVECYKEEVEANLHTPGLAGFQLLDLHDYTGQGTALVGLLDPFWEEKSYVRADEFRKFCNPIVPLVRLPKRIFSTDEKLEAPVEIANYGAGPIENAKINWSMADARGKTVASGRLPDRTIGLGKSIGLGAVSLDLKQLPAPASYRLIVNVNGSITNDWNFWLYPARVSTNVPADVLITSSWGEATTKLAAGGKVLFLPNAADLDWNSPPLDDVPIFWNRLMNPQWGRMLGLWGDTQHPALAGFPTEANCDWQWTQMIKGARAMNLEKLPRGLRPIVSAIDDWNRNWKLGVLFEAKVGVGRLMICTLNLQRDLEKRTVARQLRRSLLDYMATEMFQPSTEISIAAFNGLHFDARVMRKLGATAQAGGSDADAVIDGDPNTYWLVDGTSHGRIALAQVHRPHTLTVTFTNTVAMDGLVLMNRQNDRDHVGDVHGFEVQTSDDGTNWTSVTHGELASTWDPQTVRFGKTVTAREFRLVALSGFGDDTASALAELAVIYAGAKLPDNGDESIALKHVRSTSGDVDEGGPVKKAE